MDRMIIKLMANSIEDNYNKLATINDLNTAINGKPFLDWDENVSNFTDIVPIVIETEYPLEILQVIVNHDYFFDESISQRNPYLNDMYNELNGNELECLNKIGKIMQIDYFTHLTHGDIDK